ncbi:MAG: alpha-galactosidase [Clostridiales bacterium]|nr:alpha-galactosidase [Clostridiales bacterium]
MKHYPLTVDHIGQMMTLFGDFDMVSGKVERKNDHTLFFENDQFEIESSYIVHDTGLVKRTDTIKNKANRPLSISSALSKFVFHGGEYEVFTQYNEWCGERYGQWQPLVTEISASCDEVRSNVGAAPFVALFNQQNQRGIVFHILCQSTWKLRVRKFFAQSAGKNVTVELGLNDQNLSYSLLPGDTLVLPKILYYTFTNKQDLDAYKLHRYYNEYHPAKALPIIYNSWMSNFDNISYDILSEQLKAAKDVGAEYFVIDAGWFGRPNEWFRSVGDWRECQDASMAGRMREFADLVRAEGLKFGLWFEIERADKDSLTVKTHPEYYICENNKYFVNYADPAACDYIYHVLAQLIRKYGIEFIKFDFNERLSFDAKRTGFLEYFKGYRGFIDRINREFPSLYLENCASGGLRMSMANIHGFDSFWMSDDHSLYNQVDIFKHTMIRMPSRMLEKWITIRSLAEFTPKYGGGTSEKILVSGDATWNHLEAVNEGYLKAAAVGGPIGISCDLTKLSATLQDELKAFIREYKNERDFWISSECRILCDTESLLVLQFNDRAMDTIKLYSFTKHPRQTAVTVYPACDETKCYITSDGKEYKGMSVKEEGIDLPVGKRFTAGTLTLKKA